MCQIQTTASETIETANWIVLFSICSNLRLLLIHFYFIFLTLFFPISNLVEEMWTQIGVLSEDEVFNDTFSVNTLVQIDHTDPNTVSLYYQCQYEILFIKLLILKFSNRFRMIQICMQHFVMKMWLLSLIMSCICWKRIWSVARVKIQRSFHFPNVLIVWPFHQTENWLFAVCPMEISLVCVHPVWIHHQYFRRE